jgi:DNA mismatch repair protein MutS
MAETTPMMRQYQKIKDEQQDAILFFRLGDFYEMFGQDARIASHILGLTLTRRHDYQMCGIPYHAAQGYIARLLKAGRKIAICEQTAMPKDGKGIAEREVVEVISPGTILEEDFLDSNTNNYLMAVAKHKNQISISWIDISTGEFGAHETASMPGQNLFRREFARISPSEILISESLFEEDSEIRKVLQDQDRLVINRLPDWDFDFLDGAAKLKSFFKVQSLQVFGISETSSIPLSAGSIIRYLEQTAKSLLPHIRTISLYQETEFLSLDEATQRNLEIVRNMRDGGKKYSLLDVLDFTTNAMGARTLRRWLLNPLRSAADIGVRQTKTESLYRNQILLSNLREKLNNILDLQRLSGRLGVDKAHAKDLLSIRDSVTAARAVIEMLPEPFHLDLHRIISLESLSLIETTISEAIHEEPSILLTEGRLIRQGYNAELDKLLTLKNSSQSVLEEYLETERKASGIHNLRIRFNKIIGHFFEVTKSNLDLVPEHFIRRQSLVGSERYTTTRLSELETSINNAREQVVEVERELFLSVREEIKSDIPLLQELARWLGEIDALASFAHAATVRGYIKPVVREDGAVLIKGGRHPVVEAYLESGSFIMNDYDARTNRFAIITGPNMAGKSTYLRQIALIVLMAQCGSFVPVQSAEIGLVDKLFCRVGASDNLARGESTFLVEMNETAYILRNATEKSLVIMDEVGRGTSTNDGMAIAWAVSEYLLSITKCKTLFATHYHELTRLAGKHAVNYSLQVAENRGEIVFLKRVVEGPAESSYGVHVAQLAGVPQVVIERAEEVLSLLDEEIKSLPDSAKEMKSKAMSQKGLFDESELVLNALKSLKIDDLTPLQALNLLAEYKKKLG